MTPHEPFAWLVAAAVASIFGIAALLAGATFGASVLVAPLIIAVILLAAPTMWGRK